MSDKRTLQYHSNKMPTLIRNCNCISATGSSLPVVQENYTLLNIDVSNSQENLKENYY